MEVCADHQDVVDHSDVVIIAVRPQDRSEALAVLRIGDDRVAVSVIG